MRETKEDIKKMEKRKNKILKSMLISDKMNPIKMTSKDDLEWSWWRTKIDSPMQEKYSFLIFKSSINKSLIANWESHN